MFFIFKIKMYFCTLIRPTSGEIRECCSDLNTIIKNIMADLMKFVKDEFVATNDFPVFGAGDTITVYYEIKEGEKTRTQFFKGVVIQRRGSANTETFTIRKMSGAIGVERIFPVNLPALQKIEINKKGAVRRARIFYFRELTGKKAKIRDKRR
jgi:large subunit ribosomal protein L19